MITTTLMKHRKLIAVIVVLSLIAIYFTAATSNGWTDGAPEASIVCNIEATTGETLTGSALIGDSTVIGQLVPLTSFSANIDTLDAMTQYTISFGATMSTKTAKFGEALTNSISVTGKTGGSKANLDYLSSTDAVSSSASVSGTAGGSSTLSIPGFVKHSYTPSAINIMGDVIDGSVFTFTITSTATDGRTSSTSATLTITVDSGGKIYLSVDSITVNVVSVGGFVYPDGWNIPGHTNYIVLADITESGYPLYYTPKVMGYSGTHYASTLSGMSDDIYEMKAAGAITQTQYDCAMEQIRVLGG